MGLSKIALKTIRKALGVELECLEGHGSHELCKQLRSQRKVMVFWLFIEQNLVCVISVTTGTKYHEFFDFKNPKFLIFFINIDFVQKIASECLFFEVYLLQVDTTRI